MNLLQQPAIMQDLEIAADGHIGDTEGADQVCNANRAFLADPIQDERLALPRKHQHARCRSFRCLVTAGPSSLILVTQIAAQPTESQRDST